MCGSAVGGRIETPRASSEPGEDAIRDADTWPIKVAVVSELTARLRQRTQQEGCRARRVTAGANKWSAGRAEDVGCFGDNRRVFADVHRATVERAEPRRIPQELAHGQIGRLTHLRPDGESLAGDRRKVPGEVQAQHRAGELATEDANRRPHSPSPLRALAVRHPTQSTCSLDDERTQRSAG